MTDQTPIRCHDCVNCQTVDATIKKTCYTCKLDTNYQFMNYWKRTRAPECKDYKKQKL